VNSGEARLTATEQQVLELRISFSVQADYLATARLARHSNGRAPWYGVTRVSTMFHLPT